MKDKKIFSFFEPMKINEVFGAIVAQIKVSFYKPNVNFNFIKLFDCFIDVVRVVLILWLWTTDIATMRDRAKECHHANSFRNTSRSSGVPSPCMARTGIAEIFLPFLMA